MIESEFCQICNRPYAMAVVDICDSCLKDLPHKQLVLVRDIHKRMEMNLALTEELLGLRSGVSTAKQVEALLKAKGHG